MIVKEIFYSQIWKNSCRFHRIFVIIIIIIAMKRTSSKTRFSTQFVRFRKLGLVTFHLKRKNMFTPA